MRWWKALQTSVALSALLLPACSPVPESLAAVSDEAAFDGAVTDIEQQCSAEKTVLRVSLYPWVPEADSLFHWIERDFERRHPDIDLVVRGLERSYETDLAYEPDAAAAALTGASPDDVQDVIEIDTMTLGALTVAGVLSPVRLPRQTFLPFALEAVTFNEQVYGVPHWGCGYFVISERPDIRRARGADELVNLLSTPANSKVDLAGMLDGSWDAITVYLDALRDSYPLADLRDALDVTTIDSRVAASLASIGHACSKDGENLCGTDAYELFARGEVDGLVGYSERLNAILSVPDRTVGTLHLASATLGGGDHPVLFTDALVVARNCSGRCRRAAEQFASYYVSDEVFEVVLMAKDVGDGAVPRYLLPSTEDAFAAGDIAADELYRELRAEIRNGRAFPNSGIPEARKANVIRPQVQRSLGLAP